MAARDPEAVTISSFNLLCPAYRRTAAGDDLVRESQFPDQYMARQRKILQLPFWSSDPTAAAARLLQRSAMAGYSSGRWQRWQQRQRPLPQRL